MIDSKAALAHYEPAVRSIARRLHPAALPGHVLDRDDLCAEGRIAVLEALRAYQGHGIHESVWVRTRIRQRMIDVIRRHDPRTREQWNRRDAAPVRASMELDWIGVDGAADETADAVRRFVRVRNAMARLPKREREAVAGLLLEGLSLKEIGERLGVSESRACQLQKRAVGRLRDSVKRRPNRNRLTPARLFANTDRSTGCWVWLGKSRNNHGSGAVYWGGRVAVHRVVYELDRGEAPPKDRPVVHTCGTKLCINPAHLRLGPKVRPPRWYGEAHPQARLTEAEVSEIRRLRSEGIARAAVAARFGVSETHVSRVVSGRLWRHVA